MNLKECEKIYGKLLRECENFWYFEGTDEFGITVPKHTFWKFTNEPADKDSRLP